MPTPPVTVATVAAMTAQALGVTQPVLATPAVAVPDVAAYGGGPVQPPVSSVGKKDKEMLPEVHNTLLPDPVSVPAPTPAPTQPAPAPAPLVTAPVVPAPVPQPTPQPAPVPTPVPVGSGAPYGGVGQPGQAWQYQIGETFVMPDHVIPGVKVYVIDGEGTPAETVAAMKAAGLSPICYLSVGTAEDYRKDIGEFQPNEFGNRLAAWPQERYVDIRSPNVRRIMAQVGVSMAGRVAPGVGPGTGVGVGVGGRRVLQAVHACVHAARTHSPCRTLDSTL